MIPAKKSIKWIGLAAILLLPGIILLLLSRGEHMFTTLPHFGFKTPTTKIVDGKSVTDTIYHQVPYWSFINQDSVRVSQKEYDGQIYIVDFIFTTCPGICPVMSNHMGQLQFKLDKPGLKEIPFISYSVNPEHDTPEILKQYGKDHDADFNRWTFLTGDKRKIYELGVEGYLVSTREDALAEGGFLHSEKFILLDWDHHIRGFYNGTDINELSQLTDDIKILLKEDQKRKK
jgi:protein SCO1/2